MYPEGHDLTAQQVSEILAVRRAGPKWLIDFIDALDIGLGELMALEFTHRLIERIGKHGAWCSKRKVWSYEGWLELDNVGRFHDFSKVAWKAENGMLVYDPGNIVYTSILRAFVKLYNDDHYMHSACDLNLEKTADILEAILGMNQLHATGQDSKLSCVSDATLEALPIYADLVRRLVGNMMAIHAAFNWKLKPLEIAAIVKR